MIKFLGVLDLLGAGVLVAVSYSLDIPHGLIITFAVYLILKALVFPKDVGSFFDIAAGVILILSFYMVLPQLVFFVFAGLVGLKGLMSLFA